MEHSFERLLKIGESIAQIHANPRTRKAGEMEDPEERCLPQYFNGRAKGVGSNDLESHCVEILNNPGLYCCLNQWFTDGSSTFEDVITTEEIHYDETGYFVESENEENQIEKIPVQVAITYPGLHRWKLESLEEQIRRRGWKDQYNSPFDFYMVITSAKRTQTDSGTGLPSVTNNQDSRGTYTFEGIIKHRKGYTVEGQFDNLHQEGGRAVFDSKKCKETRGNGKIFEGEWKRGRPHGMGTMTNADGDIYKGQWLNGKAHGKGTMESTRGDIYKGQWLNGKKHGEGAMTYFDGAIYNGQWLNGTMHGEGAMTYPNGKVYKGQWENDNMHGDGTMKYPNGKVYKGHWLNNKKNGEGTLTYPNGKVYKGHWLNNIKNGEGTLTYPDGIVRKGQWLHDQFVMPVE